MTWNDHFARGPSLVALRDNISYMQRQVMPDVRRRRRMKQNNVTKPRPVMLDGGLIFGKGRQIVSKTIRKRGKQNDN